MATKAHEGAELPVLGPDHVVLFSTDLFRLKPERMGSFGNTEGQARTMVKASNAIDQWLEQSCRTRTA